MKTNTRSVNELFHFLYTHSGALYYLYHICICIWYILLYINKIYGFARCRSIATIYLYGGATDMNFCILYFHNAYYICLGYGGADDDWYTLPKKKLRVLHCIVWIFIWHAMVDVLCNTCAGERQQQDFFSFWHHTTHIYVTLYLMEQMWKSERNKSATLMLHFKWKIIWNCLTDCGN